MQDAIFSFVAISFLVVSFGLPALLLRRFIRLQRMNSSSLITRSRFSLVDLLALMFLVQLPITVVRIVDARLGELHPIAFAWMFIVSLLVWGAALLATNHLGIDDKLKRIVAMSFTFPGAIVSGFLTWLVWFLLVEKLVSLFVRRWTVELPENFPIFLSIVIVMLIGIEWSSKWIVAKAIEKPCAEYQAQ